MDELLHATERADHNETDREEADDEAHVENVHDRRMPPQRPVEVVKSLGLRAKIS